MSPPSHIATSRFPAPATKIPLPRVPQECPTRECHLDICSFLNVFAFGFVGSILFCGGKGTARCLEALKQHKATVLAGFGPSCHTLHWDSFKPCTFKWPLSSGRHERSGDSLNQAERSAEGRSIKFWKRQKEGQSSFVLCVDCAHG